MKLYNSLALTIGLFVTSLDAFAETMIVTQVGNTFSPNVITIPVGATVRWVWGDGVHTVTEGTDGLVNGNEQFHAPLHSGAQIYEVTFDQAFLLSNPPTFGSQYEYFCQPHFGSFMWGTVHIDPGPGFIFGHCNGFGADPACDSYGTWGEGCRNSTGTSGWLRATGSGSVTADDLQLQATQLPTNQNALLFVGTQWIAGGDGVAFGDGLRCVGGSVIRLTIAGSGSNGSIDFGPSLAGAGGWMAGQSRYFQVWYRDPVGGPCGSGYNLTNGIAVDFTN